MSKFDELGYALRTKSIDVPGFTRPVLVRELSADEWAEVVAAPAEKQKRLLISIAVLTPAGEQAFERDDPKLGSLAASAVDSIVSQVADMNQVGVDAVKN